KLAKAFGSIDKLMAATFDELIAVDEIGEKIAMSIQYHFQQPENVEVVQRLRASGLQFEAEVKELASNTLEGTSIVVSGVFETISRDELKQLIEDNGGKNV